MHKSHRHNRSRDHDQHNEAAGESAHRRLKMCSMNRDFAQNIGLPMEHVTEWQLRKIGRVDGGRRYDNQQKKMRQKHEAPGSTGPLRERRERALAWQQIWNGCAVGQTLVEKVTKHGVAPNMKRKYTSQLGSGSNAARSCKYAAAVQSRYELTEKGNLKFTDSNKWRSLWVQGDLAEEARREAGTQGIDASDSDENDDDDDRAAAAAAGDEDPEALDALDDADAIHADSEVNGEDGEVVDIDDTS